MRLMILVISILVYWTRLVLCSCAAVDLSLLLESRSMGVKNTVTSNETILSFSIFKSLIFLEPLQWGVDRIFVPLYEMSKLWTCPNC